MEILRATMLPGALLAAHLISPVLVSPLLLVDAAPVVPDFLSGTIPWSTLVEAQAAAEPAKEEEKLPKWSGSVTAGASISTGNSEITTASFDAAVERKGENDRITGKTYYNYSEQEDATTGDSDVTQRRAGASLKYDYFFTKKFYGLATASIEYDRIADLDTRRTVGLGAGYQFRDDEKVKYGLEAGLNYVEEGHDLIDDEEFVAARVASDLKWKVREGVDIEQFTEVFQSLEDSDDFFGKADSRAKFSLTEKMYASLQWLINYDNTPSTGKHHTDNLIVMGLGWSF